MNDKVETKTKEPEAKPILPKKRKQKRAKKIKATKALALDTKTDHVDVLLEAFAGDMDLMLFYGAWIRNGLVAWKAYKELHPDVKDESARVLGSHLLTKINKNLIMRAYELDFQVYFSQLKEALGAIKFVSVRKTDKKTGKTVIEDVDVPDHEARQPYHTKLGKILGLESEKGTTLAVQVNNNSPDNLNDEQLDAIIS